MNNWKKVFAIIWTGQFFSILTSSIVNFAIILWLSFETKSAEVLAFAASHASAISIGTVYRYLYRPLEKEAGDDTGR